MSAKKFFYILGSDCECPPDFVQSTRGLCEKVEIGSANVTITNYCLAPSTRTEYSGVKSRIYNPSFSNNSLQLTTAPSSEVFAEMTSSPQWRSTTAANGPMNRAGVWIDMDCNGIKDGLGGPLLAVSISSGGSGYTNGSYSFVPLQSTGDGLGSYGTVTVSGGQISNIVVNHSQGLYAAGAPITISPSSVGGTGSGFAGTVSDFQKTDVTVAFDYNNTGSQRTVYVGIGADNHFKLKVNGIEIASTANNGLTQNNFYIWHLFPVTLVEGQNYFNAIGTGDGSVNDSIGMTVYDNTAAQLIAATSDNNTGLNVLFSSEQLIGHTVDIATCAPGWSLDTSLGQSNYRCVRTVVAECE